MRFLRVSKVVDAGREVRVVSVKVLGLVLVIVLVLSLRLIDISYYCFFQIIAQVSLVS